MQRPPAGTPPPAAHAHTHAHTHAHAHAQHDPTADPCPDCGCPESVRACAGNTCFLLVTLVLLGDLVTDAWVAARFGLRGETGLCGVCVLLQVAPSLVTAFMYAVQSRGVAPGTPGEPPPYHLPGCLLLNVPFHLGIIAHRARHSCRRARHCCGAGDQRAGAGVEWTFAKLKLAQGLLQSGPMLVVNVYSMLVHWDAGGVEPVQYVSAVFSFLSLVAGAVNHEKVRKERVRNVRVGAAQVTCVLVYKTLMLGARVLALANFIFFYHELVAAILLPHLVVVLVFFVYVYRAVWKVRYYKIAMHAVYCLLAYIPIHNDYRPEGEILLYYTLFIIENIVMVAVPYALTTAQVRPRVRLPGPLYFYVITVCVLVGSAVGLCFMAVYYFLLHRSRASIQEHHLNWLSRFCIWSNKEDDAPARPMTAHHSPDGSRLLASQEAGGDMRPGGPDETVEHEHLLTVVSEMDESAPPPYTNSGVCPHHGPGRAALTGQPGGTGGVRGPGGAGFGADSRGERPKAVTRPSVLSGDDDLRDYDSDQDQDTRPLHVVV